MTLVTLSPAIAGVRSRPGLFDAQPVFRVAGVLIGLSLAPTLAAMALDHREFLGENVWIKPVKFQIALCIYLLSLAVFARWLPAGMTARRDYRLFSAAVILAVVAELLWVGGAAMFGTASHFNTTTPLFQGLYGLMGALAVLLTSATLVQGIAIRRNASTGLDPAVHLSVWLGLVLTFVLTVIVAGTMASQSGHFVGTPVTGAGVPVLGWSREVGDLRAPHFLATHAMHALPLAALIAAFLLPRALTVPAVWTASLLFTAAVAAAFLLSLSGLPLIPLF